ncbi:MAG: YCF48-related protein [Bacteroidales bacterium]|nr:YCF48-related protein [Bacteroidales bacterium]
MKKSFLLFIVFAVLASFSKAQDEWNIIHPDFPHGDHKDIFFVSKLKGWVVGTKGLIKFTEDGGNTWQLQHSDGEEALWSTFFVNENEGWAVGWSAIYHTEDAGQTWARQQRPPLFGDLMDVYFLNPDTGWIVGTYKTVLKTVNGGETWTKISNALIGEYWYYSVSFADHLHGIAVGSKASDEGGATEGFIMRTDDGGDTWSEVLLDGFNRLESVLFVDSVTAWVCGSGGELRKSTDRGLNWTSVEAGYHSFNDIYFFDETKGLLLDGTSLYFTFDGGQSWDSTSFISSSYYLRNLSVADDTTFFTVGYSASTFRSTDGGNSWEKLSGGSPARMNGICFFNPLDGFAVPVYSMASKLMRTNDGGYTWVKDTIIENGPFYMLRIKGQSGYLLNDVPQLMKTVNGGQDWTAFDVPDPGFRFADMAFPTETTAYLCSKNNILYKTVDGGVNWNMITFSEEYDFRKMYFYDENRGWLVDDISHKVLRTTSGGNSWTFTQFQDGADVLEPEGIFFKNEEVGFITTKEGPVFKTEDGGDNWSEFFDFGWGYQSEILFTTDLEGWYHGGWKVYHTFDGGETWVNEQNLGETLYSMFFLDKNTGWLGGDHGLVATYASTVGADENQITRTQALVFPNPADDKIEFFINKSENILALTIYNSVGQVVRSFSGLHGSNSIKVGFSELNSGIYFVEAKTNSGSYLARFVKK